MPKKTFKIGEYARGGIITVETSKNKVAVIGKEWDFSQGSNRGSNQSNAKEWTRLEVTEFNDDTRREIDNFLNDLTTSYYSDKILNWIKTKVEFKHSFW